MKLKLKSAKTVDIPDSFNGSATVLGEMLSNNGHSRSENVSIDWEDMVHIMANPKERIVIDDKATAEDAVTTAKIQPLLETSIQDRSGRPDRAADGHGPSVPPHPPEGSSDSRHHWWTRCSGR